MHARLVLLALFLLIAPAARAQVGADWTAATGGSIRPGYDLNSCSAANSGALRYNTTVSQFQVCYGSGGWATLADASGTTPFYTDRITSGTAGVFVSETGIINFRTSGVTTGYFDTAGLLVVPGISVTTANGISSTNGYFSGNVGVGTNVPSYTLHVLSGATSAATIGVFRSSNGGLVISSPQGGGGAFVSTLAQLNSSGNVVGQIIFSPGTGKIGIRDSTNTFLPSQTLHVGGTLLTTSWTGINFSGSNVTATAPLEVSGTVSATAFVGNGSGLTNLNVQGDRITSGTAGVFVSNTGIINLRTGGVTTGYFDASGLLVAPGISITTANGISATNGYFSGAIVNAPQANAGTSIDWSRGNVQYTSASCGAFTFTNMQDGGVYSLTVKGTTAGTCSFSQSGLTFRMPPNHGMVSTGTMTFYTFTRSGSDVMVNWMPGY